jgi:hypothetical protein
VPDEAVATSLCQNDASVCWSHVCVACVVQSLRHRLGYQRYVRLLEQHITIVGCRWYGFAWNATGSGQQQLATRRMRINALDIIRHCQCSW